MSANTVRGYIEILESTFMVRLLQPWFENISKRQVKSPKLYMTDSGVFHTLMGIDTWVGLQRHPKLGASWEGFALMQVLRAYPRHQAYFWATHAGAEMDLLLVRGEERLGYEFKRSDSPSTSKSMHHLSKNARILLDCLKRRAIRGTSDEFEGRQCQRSLSLKFVRWRSQGGHGLTFGTRLRRFSESGICH